MWRNFWRPDLSTKQTDHWCRVTLGSLFQIKHGFAFKGEYFTDAGQQIVLTPGNFERDGGIKLKGDKEKYYSGDYPPEFLLQRDALLVVMTDLTQDAPILGSPAFVPEDGRFLHNQRLGKIVELDTTRVDKRFLYYVFNTTSVRSRIRATASGATVKHTSPSQIYEIEIDLPPLNTQRRVASILSAYDDLIENNKRRIAILEEMVRRLYEDCFVRFHIPGHETTCAIDTETGRVPEGWRLSRLGDLATEERSGVNPSAIPAETAYVGLEHLPRRSITLTEWDVVTGVTSTKLRFQRGDILFGKIRPYLHKVAVAPFSGVCSSDTIVIRAKQSEWLPIVLCCVSSDAFVAHATQTSHGTKMPRANWSVLARYDIALPPSTLLHRFNEIVTTAIGIMRALNLENVNLCATRHLLLPKLMSGEIDVSAAPMVAEVAAE